MKNIVGIAAVCALLGVGACSSSDDSSSSGNNRSSVEGESVTDEACSSQDESVERLEPPQGACVTGATCKFTLEAGIGTCAGDRATYLNSPSIRHCSCVTSNWKCDVITGGFSMNFCPGHELDGG